MELVSEFKEFAVKGNAIDMAVGIVIGGGFGKIVTSLVGDIIMPLIGLAMGQMNMKDMKWVLQPALETADGQIMDAIVIQYGMFLQTVFDFIIVAFCIFLVVKGMNHLRSQKDETSTTPPIPSNEEMLLTEIRDLLKKKAG